MDYEERFSPYMRRRLHDDLWLSKEGPAIRHLRTSFQSRSTEQMKSFDAVLTECTWGNNEDDTSFFSLVDLFATQSEICIPGIGA